MPSFSLLPGVQSFLLGSLTLKEGALLSISLDYKLSGRWFKAEHSCCLGDRHIRLRDQLHKFKASLSGGRITLREILAYFKVFEDVILIIIIDYILIELFQGII